VVLGIVDVVVVVVDVDVVPAAIPFAAEVEVVDNLTVVDVDGAVLAVTTFGQVTDNRPTTGGGASSGHGTGAAVVVVAARDEIAQLQSFCLFQKERLHIRQQQFAHQRGHSLR